MLNEEYILKQEVVVIEIPEWKCQPNIARNTQLKEIRTKVKKLKK